MVPDSWDMHTLPDVQLQKALNDSDSYVDIGESIDGVQYNMYYVLNRIQE